jgi:dTDP-4-amino-4,6-dideoxygalactose transaminase
LQAGLLSLRLAKLDEWNNQRRSAAEYYMSELADFDGLELPVEKDFGDMVYHLFIIKHEDAPSIVKHLNGNGVGSALYYPKSLHEQEVLMEIPGFVKPVLPIAEGCASKTFAIPCYPGITKGQQDEVIATLKQFFA